MAARSQLVAEARVVADAPTAIDVALAYWRGAIAATAWMADTIDRR